MSYHFPPDGAVGGLRWAGLTKNLDPYGWESVVVTSAEQVEGRTARGVTVRSCRPFPTMNALYRRVRTRGMRQGAGETSIDTPAPPGDDRAGHGLLQRLRREASIALGMPDEGRGWIVRAAVLTRSLIRSWRPDVVVSTGPPHSAHIATWLATRGTGARWFVDLRDPWAWPFNKMWESSKYFDSRVEIGRASCRERVCQYV